MFGPRFDKFRTDFANQSCLSLPPNGSSGPSGIDDELTPHNRRAGIAPQHQPEGDSQHSTPQRTLTTKTARRNQPTGHIRTFGSSWGSLGGGNSASAASCPARLKPTCEVSLGA